MEAMALRYAPKVPSLDARHKLLSGSHFQSKPCVSSGSGHSLGSPLLSPGVPQRQRRPRSGLKQFHRTASNRWRLGRAPARLKLPCPSRHSVLVRGGGEMTQRVTKRLSGSGAGGSVALLPDCGLFAGYVGATSWPTIRASSIRPHLPRKDAGCARGKDIRRRIPAGVVPRPQN